MRRLIYRSAFFIGGIILIPALSVLNLWLIIRFGKVGLVEGLLLCLGMAVLLTIVPRKIQRKTGISAAGLLMSSTLIPLIIAIIMLIKALNSSLWDGLGVLFLALSMLITDVLVMGMAAFGLWDDKEGDKPEISDNNSDVL